MPAPDMIAQFRAARTDPTLAVLEGFHAIKHALRFDAQLVAVATSDIPELRRLAGALAADVIEPLVEVAAEVPRALFDQLSPTPPETGVIAIARRRVVTPAQLAGLPVDRPVVLLEAPSHSGNIGAVIRVAAGAGAAAVVTTGSNDPWNPGAIRGSAGLHYALPVLRADNFDIPGRALVAIDPEGDELGTAVIPGAAVLAFGTERSGLSSQLLARAIRRVRIPMEPGVSSLNLATAVAVVLYNWRLGRR